MSQIKMTPKMEVAFHQGTQDALNGLKSNAAMHKGKIRESYEFGFKDGQLARPGQKRIPK